MRGSSSLFAEEGGAACLVLCGTSSSRPGSIVETSARSHGQRWWPVLLQVHEKSILLPLMPVMLLGPDLPIVSRWLPPVACFSMYPLLKKDGLTLAYIALMLLWGAMTWPAMGEERTQQQTGASSEQRQERESERWRSMLLIGLFMSVGLAGGIHLAPFILQVPEKYPYIFDAVITSYSFLHILGLAVYLQYQSLASSQLKRD